MNTQTKHPTEHCFKNLQVRTEEMAQRLRTSVAIAENPGLIPSNHLVVHNDAEL